MSTGVTGVGNDDVLDVEGAAKFLMVTMYTLRALARDGKIPARKVGREWRFNRRALLDWLATTEPKSWE